MKRFLPFLLVSAALSAPAYAEPPIDPDVYLEHLTWPEIRTRMNQGATTVIIPSGGTEQNGPHITTGKHNWIVEYTSGEAARKLGNALVAPVIAYVPEGRISPPEGHMRFPGTVSVSETTYGALLEDAARSFKAHGFRLICFIGDHGGSIPVQQRIADKLNAEWRGAGVRVLNVSNYYKDNGQNAWLTSKKLGGREPQAHAGFADTSEMLALRSDEVRANRIAPGGDSVYPTTGVVGDPTGASAEAGRKLLNFKINAAVEQIEAASHVR